MLVDGSCISDNEIQIIPSTDMIPNEIPRANWAGIMRELCEGD